MCQHLRFGRQIPCWLLITTGLVLIVMAVALLLDSAATTLSSSPPPLPIVQVVQAVSRLQGCTQCHTQPAQTGPPVACTLSRIAAAPGEPVRYVCRETTAPLDNRLAEAGQQLLEFAGADVPAAEISRAMEAFLVVVAAKDTGDTRQPPHIYWQQMMAFVASLTRLEQQAQATQHLQARICPESPPPALALHASGTNVPHTLIAGSVEPVIPPPICQPALPDGRPHDPAQVTFVQSRRGPPAITSADSLVSLLERGLSPLRCAISFYV